MRLEADSIVCMIRPQFVLFGTYGCAVEVNVMVPVGLLFLALVVRTILGTALIIAVVWLLFKLAKLADAYTKRLQPK